MDVLVRAGRTQKRSKPATTCTKAGEQSVFESKEDEYRMCLSCGHIHKGNWSEVCPVRAVPRTGYFIPCASMAHILNALLNNTLYVGEGITWQVRRLRDPPKLAIDATKKNGEISGPGWRISNPPTGNGIHSSNTRKPGTGGALASQVVELPERICNLATILESRIIETCAPGGSAEYN